MVGHGRAAPHGGPCPARSPTNDWRRAGDERADCPRSGRRCGRAAVDIATLVRRPDQAHGPRSNIAHLPLGAATKSRTATGPGALRTVERTPRLITSRKATAGRRAHAVASYQARDRPPGGSRSNDRPTPTSTEAASHRALLAARSRVLCWRGVTPSRAASSETPNMDMTDTPLNDVRTRCTPAALDSAVCAGQGQRRVVLRHLIDVVAPKGPLTCKMQRQGPFRMACSGPSTAEVPQLHHAAG